MLIHHGKKGKKKHTINKSRDMLDIMTHHYTDPTTLTSQNNGMGYPPQKINGTATTKNQYIEKGKSHEIIHHFLS